MSYSMLTPPFIARFVWIGFALLAGTACRSTGGGSVPAAFPPVVSADFGKMRNVSVSGPIWFGGMPSAEDLDLAKRRGIRQVIDLSIPSESEVCNVPEICHDLGLEYFSAALQDRGPLTGESVDLVLECLAGEDLPPTLMFDGTGGRCATFLAIYRATELGVPIEQALMEARRAGMKPGQPEEFVKTQVRRIEIEGRLVATW